VLLIRIRKDPHNLGKPDPVHREKLYPDPHRIQKNDPDRQQSEKFVRIRIKIKIRIRIKIKIRILAHRGSAKLTVSIWKKGKVCTLNWFFPIHATYSVWDPFLMGKF
jgi:hypothetical protein